MQTCLALIGLPLFSYLLLRSKIAYAKGTVVWKGRHYRENLNRVPLRRMKCGRDAPTTAGETPALLQVALVQSKVELWSI